MRSYAFILSFPPADSSFYRSLTLVDRDGTLHAQFNIRLTQPPRRQALSTISHDFSDVATLRSQKSTFSKAARSLFSTSGDKRKPDKEKKVYTSLRRGGR